MNNYNGITYIVQRERMTPYTCVVKTGVRQCCIISPCLLQLSIDYIIRTFTQGNKSGFADDLALISHRQSQM